MDTYRNPAGSGFYYLKTRYYDPNIGRFISLDVYLSTGQGVIGNNSYAYCRNNPPTKKDSLGFDDENTTDGKNDSEEYEDITDILNKLMDDHVIEIKNYQSKIRKMMYDSGTDPITIERVVWTSTLSYFYIKVKDRGDWDLKLKTKTFSEKKHNLKYNGEIYSGEDIGNIHFGYVGRAFYSKSFLHFGAGLNQASKSFRIDYLKYFFDEPGDYDMVELGATIYEKKHLK